jgi:hypothetical protein
MGGLVIDLYVGFLARWIILIWRGRRSRDWPAVAGLVTSAHFEKPGYGGDYVLLRYCFKVNDESFDGEIRKPYFNENYANAFARRHADRELKVRVNPEHSEQSFPELG